MGHVLSRKRTKNSNEPEITQTNQQEQLVVQSNEKIDEYVVRDLNGNLKDKDNQKENEILSSDTTTTENFNNNTEIDNGIKLSLEQAALSKATTPEEMWEIVKDSSNSTLVTLKPARNRKGWKTIRLFVSSTFKDFHHEREVLVKKVFPDLRLWCESRKLRLVECDLRWGVPKDSTTEETIKICLSELDRCYDDNTAPFFLNLAGDRAGWIPQFQDLSLNVATQYGWVYGLSVTEMEIVHGAIRKLNPNALFLVRDMENKEEIPDDLKPNFMSEESFHQEKLKVLKKVVSSTFPETNVKHYSVQYNKESGEEFSGLSDDSPFANTVFDFFQSRIDELYPLDQGPLDPLQMQRDAHEMFLDSRSTCVLGRDKILVQIENYVKVGCSSKAPLLVVGTAGAGKSAIMAKSAHRTTELVENGMINMPCKEKCKVFFHFVGATPRSTDLASFLQRLVKEINPNLKEVVSDLDSLISLSYNLLENLNTMPVIIFVDAINQMDEDKQQYLSRWLPEMLSPNVRVVLSTIESTSSHKIIRSFNSSPTEIVCGPLDHDSRKAIVENILRTYNKRLDEEQTLTLLEKEGSCNPLWLTLACEELRVHGKFETLIDKINELPNDLIRLEESVFARFEEDSGGDLTKACICLLEVSRHGLLETELLALLGDTNNIKVPEYKEIDEELLIKSKATENETTTITSNIEETKQNLKKLVQETYVKGEPSVVKEQEENQIKQIKRKRGKQIDFLPARDWALIYRNLKPLLRPCGNLGEGRLDFYHRSLSKAARRRYFSGDDKIKKHVYNFWHGVLADYFESVDDMDRKAEELPYHLEQLLDNNRLIRCLMDWEVFNRLYSEEFSIDLLHAWRQCGGFGVASAVYKEQLSMLRKYENLPLIEYVEIVEKVYTFLIQAGQYSEALELMKERLDDELNRLGERPDEMADVYQNMARCKSEIDKAQQYISYDQIDDNRLIVDYGRKCLMYRKLLPDTQENSYRMACANILISHHLSNIADLDHDAVIRKEAFTAIDESIKVFTALNDVGHLAECSMTKAIIDFSQPFEVREKLLLESLSLCLKAHGEHHLLTTRIHLNTAMAYEMQGDIQKSFYHLKKLKEICLAIFGPGHPKTIRAIKTLNEPRFLRMVQAEERQTAGMA